MSELVTTKDGGALALSEAEYIDVLQTSIYPGAALKSIKMVMSYCRAANLDPMQKPVHIVPMWDKNTKQMRDVIMPGVGLYRTQAARSNTLAGIGEPEFGQMVDLQLGGMTIRVPEWCKVTVKRQLGNGVIADYISKEYWVENYATAGKDSEAPNTMWKKRPRGQLAKCAQAQALRMAFPEMTGSAPTADEMEGKSIESMEIDVTPKRENPLIIAQQVSTVMDSEERDQLMADLDAVADNGTAALKAAFLGLTKAQRQMCGTLPDAMYQKAKTADDFKDVPF